MNHPSSISRYRDDLDRMKAFYKNVFDWKYHEIPEMQYTTIRTVPTDEKGISGTGGQRRHIQADGEGPGPTELHQRRGRRRVHRPGGEERREGEEPQDVPAQVGDIAVIEDPEGNPLG
jgi:predicted enzyme related to lactoylglutathione lyase